jgi:hypothetical protein
MNTQHLVLVERLVDLLSAYKEELILSDSVNNHPLRFLWWTRSDNSEMLERIRNEIFDIYSCMFNSFNKKGIPGKWEIIKQGNYKCIIQRNSNKYAEVDVHKSSQGYNFINVKGPGLREYPSPKCHSMLVEDYKKCIAQKKKDFLFCFLAYNSHDLHDRFKTEIYDTCKDNLKQFDQK